ncbi:histidinol dehydrogenase [Bacteroidia bacterium]|nr:histidinol dehydrogenase [Bacteroidia bacterium]GHT80272.1 histidinol dehydrogenase [Bacteroidia bacterium]
MIKVTKYPQLDQIASLLQRPAQNIETLMGSVKEVVNAVRENGDEAVKKYTQQFDHTTLTDLAVSQREIDDAAQQISPELKDAIAVAAKNIRTFHEAQKQTEQRIETMAGVTCWRKSVAIERVGLYIPGGTAPLFSTVLMLGIPAVIAGCKHIVLCSPPDKNGKINPAILYAAQHIGLRKIYKTGGIQAIAAMTFGTQTIPRVDKIFGPGNAFVTAAKQYVSQLGVAIDMPAGPSEVMILADDSCVPAFVAADLLSQAEHGADSQVVLVTQSENVATLVNAALEQQLQQLQRKDIAEKSLAHSKILLVHNCAEMIEIANVYAPEHLIIATQNADAMAEQIVNAGSVFIGNYSPESAGDYASGTNHALPTAGYARTHSGVSVDSFMKKITFQKLTQQGLSNLSATIVNMADTEGLQAHSNAVKLRIENEEQG